MLNLSTIKAEFEKAVMQDDAVEMTRLIMQYSDILYDLKEKGPIFVLEDHGFDDMCSLLESYIGEERLLCALLALYELSELGRFDKAKTLLRLLKNSGTLITNRYYFDELSTILLVLVLGANPDSFASLQQEYFEYSEILAAVLTIKTIPTCDAAMGIIYLYNRRNHTTKQDIFISITISVMKGGESKCQSKDASFVVKKEKHHGPGQDSVTIAVLSARFVLSIGTGSVPNVRKKL